MFIWPLVSIEPLSFDNLTNLILSMVAVGIIQIEFSV